MLIGETVCTTVHQSISEKLIYDKYKSMRRLREALLASGLVVGAIGGLTGGRENDGQEEKTPVVKPEKERRRTGDPLPALPVLEGEEDNGQLDEQMDTPFGMADEMQQDYKRVERLKEEQEELRSQDTERQHMYDALEESFYPLVQDWTVLGNENPWAITLFVQKPNFSIHFTCTVLKNEVMIEYILPGWNAAQMRRSYVNTPDEVQESIKNIINTFNK